MICVFLVYFPPCNVSAGITYLGCTIWMLMNARASKEFVCFTIYFATCLSLRFSNSFNTPLFILEHKRTFVARAWDWIQLPLSLFPHPCLANLVSTPSEWLSWYSCLFFFFFLKTLLPIARKIEWVCKGEETLFWAENLNSRCISAINCADFCVSTSAGGSVMLL